MRIPVFLLSILIVIIFAGCSNSAKNPVDPITDQNTVADNGDIQVLSAGRMNLETGTVEPADRNVEFYYNITGLLGSNFSYSVNGLIPPDVLDLTLTINNFSPYTVNDVCIVFEDLHGKSVENADGYMDIWGPGDVDPFIAFRKENATRTFPPGIDTEQLLLKWPAGEPPFVDYFIIAYLTGNTGGVYQLNGFNYSGQLTTTGGSATIQVNAWDWQNDVATVMADTTVFTGGMTNLVKTADPLVWDATISNTEGAPEGMYPILLSATSPAVPAYTTYGYGEMSVTSGGSMPTSFGNDIAIEGDTVFTYPDIVAAGHHSMAVDGNNYYLTFQASEGAPPAESAVYFCMSNDGGLNWTTAIPLTSETDGYVQEHPVCAVGNDGIYVSYHSNETMIYNVFVAHSPDFGTTWNHHNATYFMSAGQQMDSSVSVNTNVSPDQVFIGFVDTNVGTNNDTVYVNNTTSDNLNQWISKDVSDTNNANASKYGPSIRYNLVTDNVMLIWSDATATADDGNRIYFDQSADGLTWQADMLISDIWDARDREWEGSLAYNPDTGVPGVLYRHYDRSAAGVVVRFAKATDSTAMAWKPTVIVSDMVTTKFGCSLQCDDSGRWVGAWFSLFGSYYDISFDESLDDGVTWGNDQILNDLPDISCWNPTIATNGTEVVAAWADGRSGVYEIYVDVGTH